MRVQALKGFRDYLPREMYAKSRMLDRVRRVFESFGYPPLQTPALEYSELLLGKYGEEGEMLMYRFRDHGDRDVCMRYDLTVPLARVVAEHAAKLTFPFRRYQIAPVWRAEKPGRGRYREFMQCDVDLVGVNDPAADAEMVLIGVAVLEALGVDAFQIRVNHRGVLRGLTRGLGLADGKPELDFLRLLDKLPKIGPEKLAAELARELSLSETQISDLLRFTEIDPRPGATLDRMEELAGRDPAGREGIERIRSTLELIEAAGQSARVVVDPSIARGLSYYTGFIYETFLDELPEVGSVMSGGRYDGLLGMFARRDLPAVGISLGVDRLFSALEELGKSSSVSSPARVLVALFAETAGAAVALAERLRRRGVPTLLYPTAAKLRKQFKLADEIGVPFVALVGEEEAKKGTVTLKRMDSGDQEELSFDALVEAVSPPKVD